MDREVVLIDLGSVFWAAYHSSTNEPVSAAHDRAVGKVRWIVGQHPTAHVAVCCDSPQSFRKRISPEYKATREQKDPAAIDQLRRTQETLRKDGLLLWECDGFEADDLLSTAAIKARDAKDRVTVWSADKDLLQLVCPTCVVMTTTTNTRMDRDAVFEKWGVEPDQMPDALAICGDKSDNIAGVPGVGPKGAAKLLARFGNVEALVQAIEDAQKTDPPAAIATPAVDKALRESVEVMLLAKRLTLLSRDAPINYGDLFERREMLPLTDNVEEYEMPDEPDFLDDVMGPEIVTPTAPAAVTEMQLVTRSEGPTHDSAPAQPAQKTNALSVARDGGLQPQSLDAALGFAKAICNSRLYTRFPNSEAIFAVIVRGREMGLGALTSLDNFHVIDGRPFPGAHLLISRAMAHPDCEYFMLVDGDEKSATYETKHRNNPKPTRLTYTFEQAKLAGFKPGSAWEKRTAEMLRKATGVQLGRIVYPSAIAGLYSAEEMGGES